MLDHNRHFATFALILLLSGGMAKAANTSYTGSFTADDDKRLVYFSLSSAASITVRTWSYAGGVNAAGTVIPAGGFDPTISVFDAAGKLIGSNRDGGCNSVSADRVSGFCWDSFLTLQLPAGNYLTVLTQSDNLPNGPTLNQSFVYDPALCVSGSVCPTNASGNFTPAPGNGLTGFWDASAHQRSASYALDILGASSSTITNITSSPTPPLGIVSSAYRFNFAAVSGGQAILRWFLLPGSTLPPGLSLNSATGLLSGIPTVPGQYTFNIQVTDGYQPSLAQTVHMSIYAPLVITSGVLAPGVAGTPYSATLSAAGGSGTFNWAASGLPPGLTMSSSGSISGTPTGPFSGSVIVTVTDPVSQQSAVLSVSLTIAAPPLLISGNSNLGDYAAGAPIASSFSASGGVPPYSWTFSGAPGLAVDNSGNVRGSVSTAGSFSPVITVRDSAGTNASQTLGLTILGISGNLPSGTTTSSYSGSVGGAGGVPPYSYAASGVPAGLVFSGGALTGQAKNPGTYTVGVVVTDSRNVSFSTSFTLTITGPPPQTLTITTSALRDAFIGQPYSQTLGAAGGSPAYTWVQSGGQMPAGLSLSSAGTISGSPTSAGPFSFGVQVTDAAGAQALSTVAIRVQPAQLQITSGGNLPDGLVGVDYPVQILDASGGAVPYTFSIKGTMPPGLSLVNGQIAGTPTVAQNFSFTILVTDSATPAATASLDVSGVIKPNAPDLVLSSASTGFSVTNGTNAPPSATSVVVSSSAVTQILSFSASASVPWITLSGSNSTPGSIGIALNNGALGLSSTGSPYAGTVTVTCTSDACAGKSQTITVTLTVTAAPPQLSLGSPLLSFVALASNPQASSQSLAVVNAGGGNLGITSITAADPWLSVSSVPSSIAPGPGGSVTITANPGTLSAGYYLSSITVNSSAGNATVPVTLLISSASVMTLGPAGTRFSMPQGGALSPSTGSFLVSVSTGAVNFSATVQPGAPWLVGGASGSATPSSPGTVSFSIDPATAAALTTGAYYGTIRISGSGIVNSPQDFQVVLNVSPPASRVVPDPEPAGLVFISGTGSLSSQSVQVFASSTTPIPYQVGASPIDGTGWLSVSPSTGYTSAASPANVLVSPNPGRLGAGVYRGSVSFSFGTAVRTVNVTLIVPAPLPASSPQEISSAIPRAAPACSSTTLVATQTGLVSNFSAPASWPTPMSIRLLDSCGKPVNGGQIVSTFSNGDPPLILSATDDANGIYSGTWTPRKSAAQVTILARATAPGYSTATVQIAGQVAPNQAPSLAPNGTSDVFHPQVGAGLGPGNIVQIYGSALANQTNSPAVLPLPTQLSGTSVLIGGMLAPLYYVSPNQINAQIPFELTAGSQYQVIVSANGALTTPQPIQLTPAVPAILQFTSGAVVAQHSDGTLILDSSPAAPGENVVIYLTGLGATDIPVPSGTASPSNPPARVLDTPVLALNGTQIPVAFAGLTPTLVGLYQINFQVPVGLATGDYDLEISQNGVVSNKTVLQIAHP